MQKLKSIHYKGISLTGGGVTGLVALLGNALGWFNQHVTTPAADTVCVSGLPPGWVVYVGGALALGSTLAGVLTLLKAQSTSDAVNVKAAVATGQVLPLQGTPAVHS
jgi:hypothetical protein